MTATEGKTESGNMTVVNGKVSLTLKNVEIQIGASGDVILMVNDMFAGTIFKDGCVIVHGIGVNAPKEGEVKGEVF